MDNLTRPLPNRHQICSCRCCLLYSLCGLLRGLFSAPNPLISEARQVFASARWYEPQACNKASEARQVSASTRQYELQAYNKASEARQDFISACWYGPQPTTRPVEQDFPRNCLLVWTSRLQQGQWSKLVARQPPGSSTPSASLHCLCQLPATHCCRLS